MEERLKKKGWKEQETAVMAELLSYKEAEGFVLEVRRMARKKLSDKSSLIFFVCYREKTDVIEVKLLTDGVYTRDECPAAMCPQLVVDVTSNEAIDWQPFLDKVAHFEKLAREKIAA